MTQEARDGGASMPQYGRISQGARNGAASMPKIGVMKQEIRKAVWLCLCSLIFPGQIQASPDTTDFHPFETRDQNLFNLIHGQALPTNASLNKKAQGLWSTTLAITNTLNIDSNTDESIYLDYEAYRFNFSYQYGLNDNWDLKLDVPLIHQTGGVFDSAIDRWHELWGLPQGKRPYVEHNQYDIGYVYQSQALVDLNEKSTTLGDIQIAIARSIIKNNSTAISAWMSLKLPTGDEDKLTSNGATDFSAWLALNQQMTDNWVINLNAGAVVLGSDNYKNIPLSDHAFYGHVMLGWLVTDTINLKAQLQGHTSYYDQSQLDILADTYFLTFGGSIKINRCNQLDIAMGEDINVNASPDTSLIISWRSFTSAC